MMPNWISQLEAVLRDVAQRQADDGRLDLHPELDPVPIGGGRDGQHDGSGATGAGASRVISMTTLVALCAVPADTSQWP